MEHHPLIAAYKPFAGQTKQNLLADCTGCVFDTSFARKEHHPELFNSSITSDTNGTHHIQTTLPDFGEEYFEWIDLMESIQSAKNNYVMLELGAGFGRWGVRAWRLAKQRKIPNIHILLAEADPAHLSYLHTCLADNAVPENEVTVLDAAISTSTDQRFFHVTLNDTKGERGPEDEYGQLLIPAQLNQAFASQPIEQNYFGSPMFNSQWNKRAITVKSVTMASVLHRFTHIDLVNMDIQGEEHSAIHNGIEELNTKAKMMHVSTHTKAIEDELYSLLSSNGWKLRYRYTCKSENDTPYGRFHFVDGRQSWINQRFNE